MISMGMHKALLPYAVGAITTAGEELERVSVAGGDDSAAFMAARKRAIELGLSPQKI